MDSICSINFVESKEENKIAKSIATKIEEFYSYYIKNILLSASTQI
jgi:hypothetical protein